MSNYPCHHVYCADVGSIKTWDKTKKKWINNFGWAGGSVCPNEQQASWLIQEASWCYNQEIQDLANAVAGKLNEGAKVALGFECPLWFPVRDVPEELTSGRCGDGRSWSASAGAQSLVTGLAQVQWILREIRQKSPKAEAFVDWDKYQNSKDGLFLWEAFVSGKSNADSHTGDAKAKLNQHIADAKAAVCAFVKALPSPQTAVRPCTHTRSLIGAALLWSGWSEDLCLLHEPCIVIKLKKPTT